MKLNLVGPFTVNAPFGTEIAFAKGLRQAGHEVIEIDPNLEDGFGLRIQFHRDADATVVFKSCVGNEDALPLIGPPVVVYQPDDARFPHIREMMMRMRGYADLFLSFDQYGAEVARTMGYKAAEQLLLTADPDLYSPSPEPIERDIDVSFIGSLSDPVAHASRRRMCQLVHNEAVKRGWRYHFEQTQDIARVVDVYRRSKVVLNHATDVGQPFGQGFGLQCRHFEVGMTGTCLLSNAKPPTLTEPYFPTFDSEESLIGQLGLLLEGTISGLGAGQKPWEMHAKILKHSIEREHMPIHRANQLVDFIKRNT